MIISQIITATGMAVGTEGNLLSPQPASCRQIKLPGPVLVHVVTEKGTIHAEHVVNAAGLWAKQVGRMVGVELPVSPLAHHYLVTDSIPELEAADTEMPMMIDLEGFTYMRQERTGVLVGIYEVTKPMIAANEAAYLDEKVFDSGALDLGAQQLGADQHALVDVGLGEPYMSIDGRHNLFEQPHVLARLRESDIGLGGRQGGAVRDPGGLDLGRLGGQPGLIDAAGQLTTRVERHGEQKARGGVVQVVRIVGVTDDEVVEGEAPLGPASGSRFRRKGNARNHASAPG